jgi:hypothetical protein
MKTIAYSEVPQTHSYVHLAYTSASSATTDSVLPIAFLGAVAYLLVYSVGSATKLKVKSPRIWRLMALIVVIATGLLVLFASLPHLFTAGD